MKRILSSLILLFAVVMCMQAQLNSTRPYAPYTFVSVMGGAQNTYNTAYSFGRTWTPTASVSVGHMFTRDLGLRFDVNGAWAQSNAPFLGAPARQFNYNYLTADVDLLVNIMSIMDRRKTYPFNWYLIGGVGMHNAWNNAQAQDLAAQGGLNLFSDRGYRHASNFRLGTQVEVYLCKTLSLNVEADYNFRGNPKKQSFVSDRSQLQLLAGLTFKFGYRAREKEEPAVLVPAVPRDTVDVPAQTTPITSPAISQPRKTEVKDTTEWTKVSIFYSIRSSRAAKKEQQKITDLAQWMKAHPAARATVTGYADKGTGNETINMAYSRQRAEAVTASLVSLGVEPSRLTTEARGDQEQPYADNDRNRVVIVLAQ